MDAAFVQMSTVVIFQCAVYILIITANCTMLHLKTEGWTDVTTITTTNTKT